MDTRRASLKNGWVFCYLGVLFYIYWDFRNLGNPLFKRWSTVYKLFLFDLLLHYVIFSNIKRLSPSENHSVSASLLRSPIKDSERSSMSGISWQDSRPFHAQRKPHDSSSWLDLTPNFRQEIRQSHYRNDPVKYDLAAQIEVHILSNCSTQNFPWDNL